MTDLSIDADAAQNRLVPRSTAIAAGLPVTFEETLGFIHPGHARRGVVMVSPWGYEALCMSRCWRHLAGAFSAAGLPTIRFDLPTTANALGDHQGADICSRWINSVVAAAATLRRHYPVDEIILAGFGMGNLLAAAAAEKISGVTGLFLMAPVFSGREYMRELTIRGKMIDDYLGRWPEDEPNDGALAVAGFRLGPEVAADLKKLKWTAENYSSVGRIFLADRPNHDSATKLRDSFDPSIALTEIDLPEYGALTFDPTSANPPPALLEAAARWASADPGDLTAALPEVLPRVEPLVGSSFKETPIRFGLEHRLFGVLCEPAGKSRAVIIILNTGRSPQIGWARAAVEQARALAQENVATFRIDLSSVGDSLAISDEEIFYSAQASRDVRSAIDFIERRHLGPILVVGGCSGAFAAFSIAAEDKRVRGVAMINAQRLVWDPRESIATAVAAGVRTIGAQSRQMMSGRQWRRLLTGEINAFKIARSVIGQLAGIAEAKLVRLGIPVSTLAKIRREIIDRFDRLQARQVPVSLIYGREDRGLEELTRYFGTSAQRLHRWPLVHVDLIAKTDHNVSPPAARNQICQMFSDLVARVTAINPHEVPGPSVGPASKPTRVLMIQTQAENAGAQEISRLAGGGLDARGMEVHHLFFYRRTAGLDGLPRRVDVATERPKGLFQTLVLFYKIAREIRRIRPDVVMTFQHYGNLFGAVLTRVVSRAPVIANQVSADGVTNKAIRTADKILGSIGLYSRITVNSQETMRAFENHPARYRKRIVHVPHGFENKSVEISKTDARSLFGLRVDGTLIGSAARLHPLKQLDAAIRLLPLRPDWHLAIAGQGADRARLETLATELKVSDRTFFVGELKPQALGSFLTALDVFVFPSLAETFGLAAVEAAQVGIPVVANHLDVLREVLSSNGEPAALFVDASDCNALTSAVDRVLNDPALSGQLVTAGRRLQERYSLSSMVDAYEELVVQSVR